MAQFFAQYPPEGAGGGSGVTSLNSLVGALTLVGGPGITINTDGISEITISASGVTALGNFGTSPNAKAATLTGNVLNLEPASATFPGGVSTTTQSFAGNKTFTGTIAASNLSGTNTGDVTLGTANGLSLVGQALSLGLSSTSTTGALSSTDWNTFNGKQAAGNYITALTGDVTASGPGSAAATLATVNSNVGSFTLANITVNAKGLVTAAANGTAVTSVGLSVPATSIFGVTGSPVTTTGTLGLTTTGTSGGIPYFSSTSQVASSALLAANALVVGGGAGTTPATLASTGTTTTVLHGNASGLPTFGAVSLTADVSGTLPTPNGGTGLTSFTQYGVMTAPTTSTLSTNSGLLWNTTNNILSVTGQVSGTQTQIQAIGLGSNDPGVFKAIGGGTAGDAAATFGSYTAGGTHVWSVAGNGNADSISFRVGGSATQVARMYNTAAGATMILNGTGLINGTECLSLSFNGTGRHAFDLNDTTSANGAGYLVFFSGGGQRGSIVNNNNTGVLYNVTSDYRAKKDIEPMTSGISIIQALKPVKFKWKDNDFEDFGFIAHELQEVLPNCVSGKKDALDVNGDPQYQGIDKGSLTPYLVAALQEQQSIIKQLEARLSALELS